MSEVEGLSVNYSTMNSNGSCESNLGMSEEGWMTQQAPNQETKVRPHAQAHLLSPTDKCKVCPLQDQFIVLCDFCNQVLHAI